MSRKPLRYPIRWPDHSEEWWEPIYDVGKIRKEKIEKINKKMRERFGGSKNNT
jgi:hypothetical protein